LSAVAKEVGDKSVNVFKAVHLIIEAAPNGASSMQPLPAVLEGRCDKCVQTVHSNMPVASLTAVNLNGKLILTQASVKASQISHCTARCTQILLKAGFLGFQPAAINEVKVQI